MERLSRTPLTRRELILAPIALVLAGCTAEERVKKAPAPSPETTIEPISLAELRKIEGEWTKKQIEALAREMMAEPEFNDIAFAGQLLLKNQQGDPSFSTISPVFTDEKITVVTLLKSDSIPREMGAVSNIVTTGPVAKILLLARNNKVMSETISGFAKFKFEGIGINPIRLKDASDFMLKLIFAKEIYNVLAFQQITEVCVYSLSQDYEFPRDEQASGLLAVDCLGRTSKGLPLSVLADVWAHFLMLPNYGLAKDKGKIGEKEIEEDLGVFETSFKLFLKERVLLKNDKGLYEWTQDSYKFSSLLWFTGVRLGQELLTVKGYGVKFYPKQ